MTEHTLIDVVTPPTSTSQGYTTHTCTECGYSYMDSYTDYVGSHVHDFSGSEELIEAATCTKEGSKKVYCTGDDCNEYTVVILPKIAHITGEWEIIEPTTCSKCGTKAKKCTACGKTLETADVEMIPHSYVDTVIPPTPNAVISILIVTQIMRKKTLQRLLLRAKKHEQEKQFLLMCHYKTIPEYGVWICRLIMTKQS